MKLHLPKGLLTAVIAAFAVSQTVWADWGEGGAANTYYPTTDSVDSVDATLEGKGATITISPQTGVTSPTISSVSLKSGDTLNISQANSINFAPLTLTDINIAVATGSAKMNVKDSQNVVLNGVSQGTLNVAVGESGKAASLTLNDGVSLGKLEGIAGTTTVFGEVSIDNVDLGNGGNNDGNVLVKAGAVLTAGQYWNHVNSEGAINVEKGAALIVGGLNLSGTSDTVNAKIKRNASNGGQYSLTASQFTISDGLISVANGGTINNVLSNVDVWHDTATTMNIDNTASVVGKLTVNKGTVNLVQLNADTTVTASIAEAGTLALSGSVGALNATGEGTIVVNSGATLGGDSSIATDMLMNATLSVNGNLDLSNSTITSPFIINMEREGTEEISYSDNGNGYVSGKFYLVKITKDGSMATATNTTMDGYEVQGSGTNSLYIEANGSGGTYYVNSGEVDYNAETATTSLVVKGGTLNLNAALADGVGVWTTSEDAKVINLGAGVSLSNDSVKNEGSAKATLTGDETAIYDLGSVTWNGSGSNGGKSANISFGTEWKGTTVITNSTITNHNLNDFGSAESKIKLVGVTGWMQMNGNVQRHLILEDYVDDESPANSKSAFIFNDNSPTKTYSFSKSVSGSGHFQIASAAPDSATIDFSGDTSQWTGGIVVTSAYDGSTHTPTLTVKMTGGGNIFSADSNDGFVMNRSRTDSATNTINLEIGNATADSYMNGAISMGDNLESTATLHLKVVGNTEFRKDATVTHMTVNSGKNATGTGNVTVTKNLTLNSSESINLSGNLVFADGATLTLSDSLVNTIVTGTETSYTLAVAGQITDDIQLTNTGNWFGDKFSGFELSVQDIVAPVTMAADSATDGSGQKALVLTLTLAPLDTLIVTTVGEGAYDAVNKTLTLGTALSGNYSFAEEVGITMTEDLWKEAVAAVGGPEEVTLKFTDADGNAISLDGVGNMTLMGMSAAGGTVIISDSTAGKWLIPEPTTTTLSLLALAALAVRRRRR